MSNQSPKKINIIKHILPEYFQSEGGSFDEYIEFLNKSKESILSAAQAQTDQEVFISLKPIYYGHDGAFDLEISAYRLETPDEIKKQLDSKIEKIEKEIERKKKELEKLNESYENAKKLMLD